MDAVKQPRRCPALSQASAIAPYPQNTNKAPKAGRLSRAFFGPRGTNLSMAARMIRCKTGIPHFEIESDPSAQECPKATFTKARRTIRCNDRNRRPMAPFSADALEKDSSVWGSCKAGLLARPVRNAFPVSKDQWLRKCCGTPEDSQQRELLPIHTAFPFNRAGRRRPLRTIAMQS